MSFVIGASLQYFFNYDNQNHYYYQYDFSGARTIVIVKHIRAAPCTIIPPVYLMV